MNADRNVAILLWAVAASLLLVILPGCVVAGMWGWVVAVAFLGILGIVDIALGRFHWYCYQADKADARTAANLIAAERLQAGINDMGGFTRTEATTAEQALGLRE